ncbi:hypothetical protein [Chitinophaga sp. Cy-1792]|uniref:hypothetical protein n=1 Tax=Chitinophaga sp. Cy-1792 TaxID=2608339 RepID=UPI0014221F65|nr:hypothetical protein [Chitinophaga sp. Cy-1792]NIG52334.1 hypothetical protein [Chitinophaga sp. Cy-1792]
MNYPHYQQFTQDDTYIVRGNLASKYDAIGILARYFSIVTIIGFVLLLIRVNTIPPFYFFSTMTAAFAGFIAYFWVNTISAIRKDLRHKEKAEFITHVVDKKSTKELGVISHYLLVEDNEYGIKKIDVTPDIFDQIETCCLLKLSVSRHSGTFLECELKD